ncbi:MAG: hydrogenase maturation protease [Dehalococcoidia bacterium]|nr:hydrogenase maturation protease [Dehalococcoidia bacterium]
MRALVLGMGNDLFGDDAVGLRIVEELARRPELKGFDFEMSESGGLALLDVLAGYDKAYIVDCVPDDSENTGRVRRLGPDELCCQPMTLSSHYAGLPEVLALGKTLDIPLPKIEILAVSVDDPFWIMEGLSAKMRRALPSIVDEVREILLTSRERTPEK